MGHESCAKARVRRCTSDVMNRKKARRLRAGDRISVVRGDTVVRSRAYHSHGCGVRWLSRKDEGTVWARGWYTPAARALRAAMALAS